MRKIGLVGGISWTSTLDYYKLINEGVNRQLGGLHAAECMIYSLNFADVQERTWENAYELLLNACERLKDSGADVIVLGANTAHLFADQLEDKIQLPFINIITETARQVKASGLKAVGLMGTRFTMEMAFYRNRLEEAGLTVLIPELQETRDYIQQVVRDELGRGAIREESKQNFVQIANNLVEKGAEGIILGCTEIPMLLTQEDLSFPVFNTTEIHARAAVAYSLAML